ncbi:MAG: phosphatase PAP2 family protein [Promethearchaeia archaeon]
MSPIQELISNIKQIDKNVMKKCNGIGGKRFTYFLKAVTFLGRETLWIFLILFFLFIWYDPFLFSYFFASFFSGVLIVAPIKEITDRKRPFKELNIPIYEREPTSKSFPSWHVYNIVIHGLLIGTLVDSLMLLIILAVIMVLVAFSRVQLGVHYLSDSVSGFLLAVIGFLFVQYIFGPFMYNIVLSLEKYTILNINYQQINSMLFEEIWYLSLCIVIFACLFLSATAKMIREYIME